MCEVLSNLTLAVGVQLFTYTVNYLKTTITTAGDVKFCDIFPNFRKNKV